MGGRILQGGGIGIQAIVLEPSRPKRKLSQLIHH